VEVAEVLRTATATAMIASGRQESVDEREEGEVKMLKR